MWKGKANIKGKQIRKPISSDFVPKRLAVNFDPPTLILQYLVTQTGKLYHHKMRLDSILKKLNVTRFDVLNYVKTKHHLYFLHQKLKDDFVMKFIDRILIKTGKSKSPLQKITEVKEKQQKSSPTLANQKSNFSQDDDFDYLNDDQEYEQDYEDYEEPQPEAKENYNFKASSTGGNNNAKKEQPKQKQKMAPVNKNTFMTYCQQYQDQNQQSQGQAEWDLDMDQNADFV